MTRLFKGKSAYTSYTAHALVILISSFLLFEIQFIAGKYFLPHFGGSSGVWAAGLLFFTTLLFLGYAYVYFLSRLKPRVQTVVHVLLSVLTILGVVTSLILHHSLFGAAAFLSDASPYMRILAALTLSVGAPYFLLASTSPLLQYWYGLSSAKEPYSLYAVSNAGSALALLSYPFAMEPLFALGVQEYMWALGFCAVAGVSASLCILHLRARTSEPASVHNTETREEGRPASSYMLWVLGGAFPSFLLVATTTHITEELSPIPLLWMLPLFFYLASFILAFSGRGGGLRYPLLALITAIGAFSLLDAPASYLMWQIVLFLALLFFVGVVCHNALYVVRPKTRGLPLFYLAISLGGALGALAGSIVAPLIFTDFYEFPLAIALSAVLAALLLSPLFFPRILSDRGIRFTRFLFVCFVAAYVCQAIPAESEDAVLRSRNFYGAASIVFSPHATILMHGTTMHGLQLTDAATKRLPTTYYTLGSGIGRAMAYARGSREKDLRVGVLGLGTGSLAVYCEPGDTFTYYEIDPRITALAREYFSYLSACKGSSVREGDGRLLLEEELTRGQPGQYDVLAIDAFSNDKVPAHLLTLEAMRTYGAHLRAPESILAVHVSSKYLDIAPIVVRIAEELGFHSLVVNDMNSSELASPSRWVLLSYDPRVFSSIEFAQSNQGTASPNAPLWTDSYTSIVPVLFAPHMPDVVFWR